MPRGSGPSNAPDPYSRSGSSGLPVHHKVLLLVVEVAAGAVVHEPGIGVVAREPASPVGVACTQAAHGAADAAVFEGAVGIENLELNVAGGGRAVGAARGEGTQRPDRIGLADGPSRPLQVATVELRLVACAGFALARGDDGIEGAGIELDLQLDIGAQRAQRGLGSGIEPRLAGNFIAPVILLIGSLERLRIGAARLARGQEQDV